MQVTQIEVPQLNDSFSYIIIHDVQYTIRFTYCDTFDYWTFGLYSPLREPIVQGIKIVPGHPLNLYTDRTYMPEVYFVCECDGRRDHIGRYDFRDGYAKFYYVEE